MAILYGKISGIVIILAEACKVEIVQIGSRGTKKGTNP
jgi:hypothetical protein